MPVTVDDYMKHFRSGLSRKITDYATDVVFKKSRYIFTTRKGKQQSGYCTHCNQSFDADKFKHNSRQTCPSCGSDCTVKSAGRGHKYLVDDAYFLYFEKSARDRQVVTARGFLAVRDYGLEYHNIQTQYLEIARYVFKMGSSAMFTKFGWYSLLESKLISYGDWTPRSKVFSMANQTGIANKRFFDRSYKSLAAAVKGTPFQYSTLDQYPWADPEVFLGMYSKWPSIEYLTKLGFDGLVANKLDGAYTYGAINWRGKDLFSVLKITKQDLQALKAAGIDPDAQFLAIFQISKRDGSNLSFEHIQRICNHHYFDDRLRSILKHTTFRRAESYIEKQFKSLRAKADRENTKKKAYVWRPANFSDVIQQWYDYIADCHRLEMDLKKDTVFFPRDLYRAHQNTIKQIKLKEDMELDTRIQARAADLQKRFGLTRYGMLVRPAMSTGELIAEGKALNHCVGTYAAQYANGHNIILLIRQKANPAKPFYTMEIRNGQIIQVRGKNNCSADDAVKKFIQAFKKSRLNAPDSKQKVKIPA